MFLRRDLLPSRLSGLGPICMLLVVGSGEIKQFLEKGSSLVVSIGGNDSGCATSQAGCGSITEAGLDGDSTVKQFGASPK